MLKINRELIQLNKVYFLFWLGVLYLSFTFVLSSSYSSEPCLTFHPLLCVLLLGSALVMLHFVLSVSLFLHILFFPLVQVPLLNFSSPSASPSLTTADDLGEDFHPQMYF